MYTTQASLPRHLEHFATRKHQIVPMSRRHTHASDDTETTQWIHLDELVMPPMSPV